MASSPVEVVNGSRGVFVSTRRGWFLQRRVCLVPTWRGWLALLVVTGLFAAGVLFGLYPFLAVRDPQTGGIMVVEGWTPDYGIDEAIAEYKRGGYSALYSTGGPIEWGAPLSEYGTIAEVGLATIHKKAPGLPSVYAVSAPEVRQDRTYASAVALRKWCEQHGGVPATINLVSGGPHSRRSRLLFQHAFGPQVKIGIVPVENRSYDPNRWWASSMGFRDVTGEAIAYLYARFLVRTPSS